MYSRQRVCYSGGESGRVSVRPWPMTSRDDSTTRGRSPPNRVWCSGSASMVGRSGSRERLHRLHFLKALRPAGDVGEDASPDPGRPAQGP